jgi:hypothetical protein
LLAYLFWHRLRPGIDAAAYEEAQREFHERLEVPSACFRLEQLPFDPGAGYEDWYLVEDWRALGELNAAAVDGQRGDAHDRAAALVGEGWGAVYASLRGPVAIPESVRWSSKPPGPSLDQALEDVGGGVPVWRRQLVLGPAPEICVGAGGPTRSCVVPWSPLGD